MTLPLGLGDVDLTDWVRGLFGAAIQGGAGAVTASFVASTMSKDLAIGSAKFFELVFTVFAVNGTLGFFAFLSKQPLPPIKTVTTSVQSTQIGSAPPMVTTKVSETHTEQITPEAK